MMKPARGVVWWWWFATAVGLGARVGGWAPVLAVAVAMAMTVAQGLHLAFRARSLRAFPVQVRAAYLALLAVGCWPPLAWLPILQLTATAALLVFDYCTLARLLSLLPWNRRGPLTWARLVATFASRPVRGSIIAALNVDSEVPRT